MGWGGRVTFRGLVQTDNNNLTGRTVINRGQIGTIQYRLEGPRKTTTITGVSRDNSGAALGSCVVELLQSGGDILVQSTISDASGNFTFINPGSGPFLIRAYKDGAPNLAGVSDRNLIAV
jgi:hypothetical protein